MPAENLAMRIRVRTEEVVRQLERLRDAFRVAEWAPIDFAAEGAQRFQEGGLIHQPESVHLNSPGSPESQVAWHHPTPGLQDCPICRDLPQDVLAERAPAGEELQHIGIGTRLDGELLPHRAEDCPICRELHGNPACQHTEERDRFACSYGYCPDSSYRILPNYVVGVALAESVDRVAWVALNSVWTGSSSPAGERPPAVSYTGGENGALEAIRLAGERPNEGLAAQYRPVEGPTAACSACPALVAPETLWVGKKSGIALCDPCMTKWEKAGRAKRTGEF
jgi:hypothetical protein